MASLQRRARLRVALSTRLHWTQFRIPRRNRPWAFTATCAACLVLQASLLASPAAHAETRCTYFVDYENFSATGAVAYTFGWDIGRNVLPEAIEPFNSVRETSCGIESWEFVRRAGPFRVIRDGEFDVVYYDQHVRRNDRVDGQCVTREYTITFPNLDANGNADRASDVAACVTKLDAAGSFPQPEPLSCRSSGQSAGNPILPATAEKYEAEVDFEDAGPAPLRFVRTYRSTWGNDALRAVGTMGKAWAHNHGASLQWTRTSVTVAIAEGYKRTFTRAAGSNAWITADGADTLTQDGTFWIYRRADDDAVLRFDDKGKLLSVATRNGWVTTFHRGVPTSNQLLRLILMRLGGGGSGGEETSDEPICAVHGCHERL